MSSEKQILVGFIRFLSKKEIDFLESEGTIDSEGYYQAPVFPKDLIYMKSWGIYCEQGAVINDATRTIISDKSISERPFLVKTSQFFDFNGIFVKPKSEALDISYE